MDTARVNGALREMVNNQNNEVIQGKRSDEQ
jgi:hypothetical protein